MSAQDDYKECPACAEWIRRKAKICRYCGAVLEEEGLPEFVEEPPALKDYSDSVEEQFHRGGLEITPSHRRRIVEFLNASEDQYRIGTVLFVDIVGYTRLTQQLSAEVVRQIIDVFSSIFVQTVELYNGFVVEFAGDGALAMFGAPVGFERDAEAAVHAAVEIARLAATVPLYRKHKVKLSSGVATGIVLSTVIHTTTPPHYKIYGYAINLASRLRTKAKPDQILIDAETHDLVKAVFETECIGTKRFRNVTEGVEVFHVTSAKKGSIQRRDFTNAYVGREREQQWLRLHWEQFRSGSSGRMVPACAISGEPGIGKSRLTDVFLGSLHDDARVIKYTSTPYEAKLPWHLWRALLANLWEGSVNDGNEQVRAGLRRLAEELGLSTEIQHSLQVLLGLRKLPEGGDPAQFQQLLSADIAALLQTLARGRPLLVVLDDMQWVDASSIAVLTRLLTDYRAENVFFLLIHRSDFEMPPRAGEVPTLRLLPLSVEERRQLLNLLLDVRQFLPEIREKLTQQLDGTPYYLVEVIRSLRSRIQGSAAKQLKLPHEMKNWVPRSLHEMLQARLDMLDSQRKTVLQCASVIGHRFALETLDLYDHIREGLISKLFALKSLDYIDDIALPQDLEFIFRHSMMREVAYQSLLENQRRELHRMIAERLEKTRRGGGLELHYLLAHHYDMADEAPRAIQHLVQSGLMATDAGAVPEATENFETALRRLEQQAPTADIDAQKVTTLYHLGLLYRYGGEIPRALEAMQKAAELAQKHRRDGDTVQVGIQLGLLYAATGEYRKASAALQKAQKSAEKRRDRQALAEIHNARGLCEWNRANWKEARAAYTESNRLLTAKNDAALASDIKNNLGLLEWKDGHLDKARALLSEALKLRRKAGNRFGIAITRMNLGIIEEQSGKLKAAERNYREAITIATDIRFVQVLSAAHANLANLYLTLEEYAKALQEGALSLELAENCEDPRSAAIACENLALSAMGLHQWEDTERWLQQGKATAEKLKDHERLFSLDLVRLEALLLQKETADVKGLLKRVDTLLARKNGYVAEAPRVLRLRAMEALNRGDAGAARRHAEEGLKQAGRVQNASEQQRLRRFLSALGKARR